MRRTFPIKIVFFLYLACLIIWFFIARAFLYVDKLYASFWLYVGALILQGFLGAHFKQYNSSLAKNREYNRLVHPWLYNYN